MHCSLPSLQCAHRPPRRARVVALSALAVIALGALPAAGANERDSAFFSSSGVVCIEGINATTVIPGGLQFQSATRSLQSDCVTPRPLSYAYVSTATGIRAIDGTTGERISCGYRSIGFNADGTARADAPYILATGAWVRSICGIPSGHFAAAGAYSFHQAVVWGSWTQDGVVTGAVSNVI